MSKLHLATNQHFNYLGYLAIMSAILHNEVVFWYENEPKGKWWELIKKTERTSKHLEFQTVDPLTGVTIDQYDNTGRLDIIYLAEFTPESIDEAFIDHKVLTQDSEGEFEKKDITLVRVFPTIDPSVREYVSNQDKMDFITPQWVSANDTLLSELIKRVFLERVWNPYGREEV